MSYQITDGEKQRETSIEQLTVESDYTILYFYPKNNTPGCTVEAQEFTKLSSDFTALHTRIIGVSKDSIDSHCSFIKKHGLRPLYISDTNLSLHKRYDARGEKNMYGKIKEGVIRSTVLFSNEGTVIKHRHNVKAKGHAQRVLDYIKQNTE